VNQCACASLYGDGALSLPYAEGDLFCVPVGAGRYMLGLIARVAPRGRIISAYLFRGVLEAAPAELPVPDAQNVLIAVRVGDLGLMHRTWPVVRRQGRWDRQSWPIPVFGRVNRHGGGGAWRIEYPDENPNSSPKETKVSQAEARGLPRDGLYGHVALERLLVHLLLTPGDLEKLR
jgi:hypothetical protein